MYWGIGKYTSSREYSRGRSIKKETHGRGKRGKYDDQIHSPLKHPDRKRKSRYIWVVLGAKESV